MYFFISICFFGQHKLYIKFDRKCSTKLKSDKNFHNSTLCRRCGAAITLKSQSRCSTTSDFGGSLVKLAEATWQKLEGQHHNYHPHNHHHHDGNHQWRRHHQSPNCSVFTTKAACERIGAAIYVLQVFITTIIIIIIIIILLLLIIIKKLYSSQMIFFRRSE